MDSDPGKRNVWDSFRQHTKVVNGVVSRMEALFSPGMQLYTPPQLCLELFVSHVMPVSGSAPQFTCKSVRCTGSSISACSRLEVVPQVFRGFQIIPDSETPGASFPEERPRLSHRLCKHPRPFQFDFLCLLNSESFLSPVILEN